MEDSQIPLLWLPLKRTNPTERTLVFTTLLPGLSYWNTIRAVSDRGGNSDDKFLIQASNPEKTSTFKLDLNKD